jgi:hypothetical protein
MVGLADKLCQDLATVGLTMPSLLKGQGHYPQHQERGSSSPSSTRHGHSPENRDYI